MHEWKFGENDIMCYVMLMGYYMSMQLRKRVIQMTDEWLTGFWYGSISGVCIVIIIIGIIALIGGN